MEDPADMKAFMKPTLLANAAHSEGVDSELALAAQAAADNGSTMTAFETTDRTTTSGGGGVGFEKTWWKLVEREFSDMGLKKCFKRGDVPPITGNKCSKRQKVCFFGEKTCSDNIESQRVMPQTGCRCGGEGGNQTWSCVDVPCSPEQVDKIGEHS